MIFCAKNKPMNASNLIIKINNANIDRVRTTKFLGVIIDEKLTWSYHINYIATKISKSIGVICRVRKVLNGNILRNLYFTFIYPYLLYCNIVWGLACQKFLNKLHLLQKRAVRIICGSPRYESSKPLFQKLNISDIYSMNKIRLGLLAYKLYNFLLPELFQLFLTRVADVHSYSTRQSEHLYIVKSRTNYRMNFIYYQAPLLWNTLDRDIKLCETVNAFKKRLTHIYNTT